jgi:hypothetical protein
MNGPVLLRDLAEQTGGREFDVDDPAEMADIAAKIGIELRNRYVLGFSPTAQQRDGKYHHVMVKVIPPHGLPPLKAFWRPGYLRPWIRFCVQRSRSCERASALAPLDRIEKPPHSLERHGFS